MYCRLCLTEQQYNCETRSIFDGEDNLAEIIAKHFPFQPKKEDTHKIICMECCEILENFHIFYTKIEEAQKRLLPEIVIKLESAPTITKNPPDFKSELQESETDTSKPFLKSLSNFDEIVEQINVNESDNAPQDIDMQLKKLYSKEDSESENYSKNEKNLRSRNKKFVMKKKKSKQKSGNKKVKIENDIDIDNDNDDNTTKIDNKKAFDDVDKKISDFIKLRCDICLKEETTFTDIKKHFRSKHNMLGYVICCDKKFDKRVYLSDHVDTHINPEQFKCQICNRIQANHNSLRQHIKVVHETPRTWECDVCQKKMANRSALELHKYTHIPVEERTFKCADCEKTFASEYQMKMHWSKVHESLANNICYVCGKIIKDAVLFKKHQLEHEGIVEPKAQCETCGLWLKNVLSLRKHIRNLHSEADIDHICNICDKLCRSKAALKSHRFYVHSSRTYPCTVCGKEFKKSITLKEHMSTHTGEVLYTCPHCPKTFTSNANLHHHRKKNHRKEWEEKRAEKRASYIQPPFTASVDNASDVLSEFN